MASAPGDDHCLGARAKACTGAGLPASSKTATFSLVRRTWLPCARSLRFWKAMPRPLLRALLPPDQMAPSVCQAEVQSVALIRSEGCSAQAMTDEKERAGYRRMDERAGT